MKKTLKIVGYTLGIVVLLVAVAAIALPFIINPNDYKGQITRLVHDKTGRDLTISGDIQLSVFPWLGVEVKGVALSNAPGFGEQPFASIDEADVSVRLLPLVLRRQVRVGMIKLQGLEVHLARSAAGTSNWSDLAQQGGGGDGQSQGGGGGALAALTVGGVEVDNATFTWDDAQSGHHYAVRHLKLTTGAVAIGQAFPMQLAFDVDANAPAVSGHIALTGEVNADPANDNFRIDDLKSQFDVTDRAPALQVKGDLATAIVAHPGAGRYKVETGELHFTPTGDVLPLNAGELVLAWRPIDADIKAQTARISSLQLSGLGMRMLLDVQGSNILTAPVISGRFDLPASSPETLVKALRRSLPAGVYPAELGQVGAQARFTYDAAQASAALKGLVVAALGAEFHADADVSDLGQAPKLSADIAVPAVAARTVFSHLGTIVPPQLRNRDTGNLGFASHLEGDIDKGLFQFTDLSAQAMGVDLRGQVDVRLADTGPQVAGTVSLPPFALARTLSLAWPGLARYPLRCRSGSAHARCAGTSIECRGADAECGSQGYRCAPGAGVRCHC